MEDLHLSVQSVHFLLFSLVLSVMIKISMLPRSLRPDLVFSCIFYDPFTPKPIKPIFKIHLFSQKKFKVLFLCFCPTFLASILKLGQVFLCVIPLTDLFWGLVFLWGGGINLGMKDINFWHVEQIKHSLVNHNVSLIESTGRGIRLIVRVDVTQTELCFAVSCRLSSEDWTVTGQSQVMWVLWAVLLWVMPQRWHLHHPLTHGTQLGCCPKRGRCNT